MIQNTCDIHTIKNEFPIFKHYPNLVYLDNSATSQKPYAVISAVNTFYEKHNANIHRGIYSLSQDATSLFEQSRRITAEFIGARTPLEIVYTGNASEAINLVAYGWARKHLKCGDIVITTEMEHHSNIVPWLRLKQEIGIQVIFLPIKDSYKIQYKDIEKMDINPKRVKLAAITHASNVLGTINPIQDIISYLKSFNVHIKILIDAAQSIPHIPINVRNLGCDFLVFSSHKMLGPSGVGVLWARENILQETEPLFVGSHMVNTVTTEKASWADLPDKFETGTRNLEGVIGLQEAIKFIRKVKYDAIEKHEKALTQYALDRLHEIDDLTLYGPKTSDDRLGIFSFNLAHIHAHDVAEILNRDQIAIRSGHHCAQTVMQFIKEPATSRASLYLYNTKDDIDRLVTGLLQVKKVFNV